MRIDLLGHGYVRFVEDWGRGDSGLAEAGIIEAARQSTAGSFRGWEQDAKLLKHLYDNKHSTPFEFAGMVIEVKAPIMVFREWHRHRTQAYNEMSARYTPLPDENYLPGLINLLDRANTPTTNKQAAGAGSLTSHEAIEWLDSLDALYNHAQMVYQKGLAIGVPKEIARLPIPVARYSKMRATTSLRCWLMFLTLRMDPAAQWEIRQYANAVGEIIAARFPQTWELFKG